jgi:sulfur carrier protein
MKVQLNGESQNIPDHSTAQTLVDLLELGGKRLAMELNHEIVPRSLYLDTLLHEGDQIEIVHAIGGG